MTYRAVAAAVFGAALLPAAASALPVEVRATLTGVEMIVAGAPVTGELELIAWGDSDDVQAISNGLGIFDSLPVASVRVSAAGNLSPVLSLDPGDLNIALDSGAFGFFADLPDDATSAQVLAGFSLTAVAPGGFLFDSSIPETAVEFILPTALVGTGAAFPLDFPGLAGVGIEITGYGEPVAADAGAFQLGEGFVAVSVEEGVVPLPAAAPLLAAGALALAGVARRRRRS
jgi:hypothetical protein